MSARGLLAALVLAVWILAGCRANPQAGRALPFALALEFEGQQSVSAERLDELVRAELARLEVTTPDKAAVDDAAFALELFYRSRGHLDALVEYEFEPTGPRAHFCISEGAEVHVAALELVGLEVMTPQLVRTFFGPMEHGGVYDEEQLKETLEVLRLKYRELGHLRIAIEPPAVEFDAARSSVTLRITLHEGPQFRVKALEFSGGVPALAEREAQLTRQYTGPLYQTSVGPGIENTLREEYLRRGYPDASFEARPEFDETSGDVRLLVRTTPGERVTVAHIRIQGNARTKDAAILGFMGIELGSVYDVEKEREAFRELYATGLFESITLHLEGAGPERTLAVELVEARSVEIRIEPGLGSYEGPRILLGIEENNFQGRGQNLALEGTASLKAQSARIGWIDRDFLGSHLTAETTFFVEQREEPSFTFVRRGFGFFLRRRWTSDWSSSLGYEFRPTDVTDSPNTVLPPDVESNTNVAEFSTSLVYDDRDSPLLPSRGRRGLAKLEWADDAFASDTEFLRARLEYTELQPIGRSVLAFSARTGLIAPFGLTSEIPLPERFFNGGESSVRSFQEDELQPAGVFGDPLGGESATTLNLELRRELTGNLGAALFYDLGNVTQDVQDYLDFAGFRSGLGVGLRYQLPIGPVRLDLGWNPNTQTDPFTQNEDDEYVLHFSVGFPF